MNIRAVLALTTALTLGCTTQVFAEEQISLRSQDGAVDLKGAFVSLENNVYTIRTELGLLNISAERVDCFGDTCPAVEEVKASPSNEVTIRSLDGALEISGVLLSFENDNYLLETSIGKLQIAAGTSSCAGAGCPSTNIQTKTVSLSSSGELSDNLMLRLIERFAERQGAQYVRTAAQDGTAKVTLASSSGAIFADVNIGSGSSTNAVQDLLVGTAHLAATTRPLNSVERDALIGPNADDFARSNTEIVLALDAIAIVVHPDNPVRAIGEQDIAGIFAGDITDWSELGGNPGAINIYARSEDSGTSTVFNSLVMSPARTEVSPLAKLADSDRAVSEAVSADPLGVGYTSFSTLEGAKSLAIRGECGIQTPVNDFTIKTEEYPLARRVYMYRPLDSVPQTASDFLDFVKSTEAQAIVTQAGYIGQDVTSVSVNEQGLRFISSVLPTDADATYEQIQNMLAELVAADRLSLTFRFEPGSARLDTRSQADVLRLAEMIERGDFENKEILVVGFTDSIGLGEINLGLSQARAEQVKQTILNATKNPSAIAQDMKVIGYGEMSPLGCNETFGGRAVNRRVEVWTKDIINSRL